MAKKKAAHNKGAHCVKKGRIKSPTTGKMRTVCRGFAGGPSKSRKGK